MGVVLVHEGDVVIDVLLIPEHAPESVLDDHRHLVGEGWIICHAIGDVGGEQMAVPVLVLQALAVKRSSSSSTAEQEAAAAHVACSPSEIADSLEPEH